MKLLMMHLCFVLGFGIGAAAIMGGAALLSSIFAARARKKEVEDERMYNSPEAQRERLEAAGISPFGQQFENTSTGMPDMFSNVASGFGDAVKTGAQKYLELNQQKVANEIARDQLNLQKDTLAATKEYRKSLMDYYNDKLQVGVTQFGMRQRLNRDAYNLGVKKFSWEKKKWNESMDLKRSFYTDPSMLGYWQTQNVINQIATRNRLTPFQISLLDEQAKSLVSRRSLTDQAFQFNSQMNPYKLKSARIGLNSQVTNWNTMARLLPAQRKFLELQLGANTKYQQYLLDKNLNAEDFINDLMKLNRIYNATMENVMGTRSNIRQVGLEWDNNTNYGIY